MAKIYAPSMPMDFDSQYGFKNVEDLKELVKFHLTNLLLTYPGEKISNPSYGVGLRRFLFEPLVSDTILEIETEVEEAMDRHLEYLLVKRVTVYTNQQDTTLSDYALKLQIQYVIKDINESDVLEVDLSTSTFATSYGF